MVYAVGQQVRTRRWTWRQSEHGKITADSSDIFFPIDGFTDFNRENVIKAQTELDSLLKTICIYRKIFRKNMEEISGLYENIFGKELSMKKILIVLGGGPIVLLAVLSR